MLNIQAFLNPMMQRLTLAYSSSCEETISIAIRNSIGETVFTEYVRMENGVNLMQIQAVKDFKPGHYTLELQKADRLFYTKNPVKN